MYTTQRDNGKLNFIQLTEPILQLNFALCVENLEDENLENVFSI